MIKTKRHTDRTSSRDFLYVIGWCLFSLVFAFGLNVGRADVKAKVESEGLQMCDVCRQHPCDVRCPNADVAVAFTCDKCSEDIEAGNEYYEIEDKRYCWDCVRDSLKYAEVQDGEPEI